MIEAPITPESFRQIDRYRPDHEPYLPASEIRSFDGPAFRSYAFRIAVYLRTIGTVTLHESYYLYFLSRVLAHFEENETRAALDFVTAERKVVLPEQPRPPVSPSVVIPGLENVMKVNWRFLPDPENLSAAELLALLRERFSEHSGHVGIRLQIDRIEFALSLKPEAIFVGLEEFAGYYAFIFPSDVVLFECPAYGNAAYIVRGDWRALSQQYKAQLEKKGVRVIHSASSWKWKIRWAVGKK